MAESFNAKIGKLAKDLAKEISRLQAELTEKQSFLKSLKGMGGIKITRRGRKPGTVKRVKRVVGRRGRPPRKRGRVAMSNRQKVFKIFDNMGGKGRFRDIVR